MQDVRCQCRLFDRRSVSQQVWATTRLFCHVVLTGFVVALGAPAIAGAPVPAEVVVTEGWAVKEFPQWVKSAQAAFRERETQNQT